MSDPSGLRSCRAPPLRAADLGTRLPVYCLAKKYQVRADAWVGLGVFAGPGEVFQLYCANHDPWVEADKPAKEALEILGLGPVVDARIDDTPDPA